MFAKAAVECNLEAALKQLVELGQWIAGAARAGTAAHVVERHLFRRMLTIGGTLLGEFFKSVGPGDLGETVTLENGQTLNRWPGEQGRRLVTVFGEFALARYVYGTRPGQKIQLVPTDQRLRLPECRDRCSEPDLRKPSSAWASRWTRWNAATARWPSRRRRSARRSPLPMRRPRGRCWW